MLKFMRPWMLEAPPLNLTPQDETAFKAALDARNPDLLPSNLPRWMFLQWLAGQGYLLHGSKRGDITEFQPRTPHDLSPDEFSKRTGVFAASDGLWAMMYALKDRALSKRILNMALQVRKPGGWSDTRYFLSFGPIDAQVRDGRALVTAGFVYVLPGEGFTTMPPYDWPGLGEVMEPHWVNENSVKPLMCIPVTPNDFPLPIRVHDADRVDALCESDPWGFPWLSENEA